MIIITGLYIGDKRLVITTEPKTFHFDLPKDLQHKIYFVIKLNEYLAEHTMKNEIICMETTYKKTEKSKTNELQKFILNLSQRFYLRSSIKYAAL